MIEGHSHCKDTGTNTTIVRSLIAYNGARCSIHNKPDVTLDTTDFDIGFIGGENLADVIVIVVNKRLYADSGCFTVVGDLLVRYGYVVKVFQSLFGFP